MSDTMMLTSPMIVPPPRPWSARQTMSHSTFCAAPQSAEKTVKTTMAA
jgi:hypothetical protein